MGDVLGKTGLDIEVEKKLIEAKLLELKDKEATEENIKVNRKDMGMERYVPQKLTKQIKKGFNCRKMKFKNPEHLF